jgi:hypothetical protein
MVTGIDSREVKLYNRHFLPDLWSYVNIEAFPKICIFRMHLHSLNSLSTLAFTTSSFFSEFNTITAHIVLYIYITLNIFGYVTVPSVFISLRNGSETNI